MKAKKISDLTIEQLKEIINQAVKENMEDVLENIEALSSKRFVKSVERSRKEYKEKKFKDFKEVFNV
ncbi:MAG: hypothetical protein IT281_07270 [Ignavibacteria bacterium]|nr:hypothetical protein [Ignavibacteria bacterium]MCC7159322.1 hypothetical protein [Ignavibacteria bacterium]